MYLPAYLLTLWVSLSVLSLFWAHLNLKLRVLNSSFTLPSSLLSSCTLDSYTHSTHTFKHIHTSTFTHIHTQHTHSTHVDTHTHMQTDRQTDRHTHTQHTYTYKQTQRMSCVILKNILRCIDTQHKILFTTFVHEL